MLKEKKRGLAGLLLAAAILMTGCGGTTGESGAAAGDNGKEVNAAGMESGDAQMTDVPKTEAQKEAEAADSGQDNAAKEESAGKGKVASAEDMVTPEDVVEEGMEPVYGESVKDGTYEVTVDSSSSMFQIESCELTAADGEMTAVMTMGGTGYLYLYPGTGEEAAAAGETEYIPFVEDESGKHTFAVPVEALDMGIDCAAFSKRKQMWYDRVLLFRADSLPMEAFEEGMFATVESLGLTDGEYTIGVELTGGSGRASVESPARLVVEDGQAWAYIIWSSSNYDYMKVDEVQYDMVNQEPGLQGGSAFKIPVAGFDYKIPVKANTTAMSTPHEIDYTLEFDSSSIE